MYLLPERVRDFAQKKRMTLETLLKKAKVSKTAYYHLTRKENLLPKSILALAQALEVLPSDLLEEKNRSEEMIHRLRKELEEILFHSPNVDPENVWHTLLILELSPWERLDRGLLRAQKYNIH